MERSDLLQITDIETIKRKYQDILGERVHTDGTHPLYNKGIFDGMAIILEAITESINKRKKITHETTVEDK